MLSILKAIIEKEKVFQWFSAFSYHKLHGLYSLQKVQFAEFLQFSHKALRIEKYAIPHWKALLSGMPNFIEYFTSHYPDLSKKYIIFMYLMGVRKKFSKISGSDSRVFFKVSVHQT